MSKKISRVIKRSGAIVPFKQDRIANAIYRAVVSVGGRDKDKANELAEQVINSLSGNFSDGNMPHIEDVQDAVEKVLIKNGHSKVAKEYILYRDEASKRREAEGRHHSKHNEDIILNIMKIYRGLRYGEILIGQFPITFTQWML